jgi:hypothetical protein
MARLCVVTTRMCVMAIGQQSLPPAQRRTPIQENGGAQLALRQKPKKALKALQYGGTLRG